jgi:hypothetical protein
MYTYFNDSRNVIRTAFNMILMLTIEQRVQSIYRNLFKQVDYIFCFMETIALGDD